MTSREIAEMLNNLSENDKKILFELLQEEESENISVDSLFSNGISCPICGDVEKIVKNGKRAGIQRYICKHCKKSFVANTNSILERTHKPLSVWKKFLECMVHGMSILKTAELCEINKNTAFAWRHKVLDALSQIMEDAALEGIVEADETFFILSYKGQKSGLPRKPKRRGEKASKRGLSREQVCVPCAIDRKGKVVSKVSNLGRIQTQGLHCVFDGKIKNKSILCTDKASAYVKFSSDNDLKLIQIKGGKEKLGIYHINHVNAYHSELKRFMKTFKGVSTKYLNNYLTWNIFASKRGTIKEKVNGMFEGVCKVNLVEHFTDISNRPNLPIF